MRRKKANPFGQRAKAAMSELVFGKDVKLRPHTIDRYGRLLRNWWWKLLSGNEL
jgi:endonuclease YncB( thermonuclease family)